MMSIQSLAHTPSRAHNFVQMPASMPRNRRHIRVIYNSMDGGNDSDSRQGNMSLLVAEME